MREIIKNSFWQLIGIYVLIVLLATFGLFGKYTLQLHIFALIIGILGCFAIYQNHDVHLGKRRYYIIFCICILLIIGLRLIPYVHNNIPLGYDAGLYKYGIEHGLANQDQWILSGGMEPGFLYLMKVLSFVFNSETLLIWIFILFTVLLGLAIYTTVRIYFGRNEALIALMIYSLSVVQYKVFEFMYYKNIIGLALMLFAISSLKLAEKNKKYYILFVILAGFLGSIHRPTFYIFGLSYFVYAFIEPYKSKYDYKKLGLNVILGIIILVIAFSFYIGKFMPAILSVLPGVTNGFVNPGESPGTFISFFQYQYLTLAYLPFAIIGLVYLIRKKRFNMVVIWTILNFLIVYFQFFFYNRFIIHLDIALILCASIGFTRLIEKKKLIGAIILSMMLVISGISIYHEANSARPLIDNAGLTLIKKISNNTETDARIMIISKDYSPWVIAYSDRKVIAPGLFDDNVWNEGEWITFWNSNSSLETKEMMSVYPYNHIYLFAGRRKFNNPCFSIYLEENENRLYKYVC